MGPLLRVPNHPLALARFGLPDGAPRVDVRQDLPHRAGAGIVRWCCGTYV